MVVEIYKEKYRSRVREVVLGATVQKVEPVRILLKLRETTLPFLHFKGRS